MRQLRQLRHTIPADYRDNGSSVVQEPQNANSRRYRYMMFDPFAQASSLGYGGTQPYGYIPQQLFPTFTGFGVSPQFSGFGFGGINPWATGISPFTQVGVMP